MSFRIASSFILFFLVLQPSIGFSQQGFYEGFKAEKSGGLWGFKNTHNKWEIIPQYDTVYHPFEFGKAIVGKGNLYAVVDLNNKIIIPFFYREILPEYKHLFPVKNRDGKWGFVNTTGTEVFPTVYDNFRYEYKDKHLLLQLNGRWGIYTPTAQEIIKPIYKQIFYQQQQSYKVLPFSTFEILSSTGTALYTLDADHISLLTNATFAYSILGKKGICTATEKMCAAVYQDIIHAYDTLYFAKQLGLWNMITLHGEKITSITWLTIKIEKEYFVGHLDPQEKQIYTWPCSPLNGSTYKEVGTCDSKNWLVKNEFNLWGTVTKNGEQVISFRYDSIAPFEKGIARATLKGEHIIINEEGALIINAEEYPFYNAGILTLNAQGQKEWMDDHQQYSSIVQLSKMYYRVQGKNNRIGIVNEKGDLILPCQFDAIHLSTDNSIFIARQGLHYLLFDHTGKILSGPHKRFEDIVDVSEGYIKVKFKGALGFCDYEGRIMISTQYEETGIFKNGICAVKLRGLWAYIDKEEKIILQPYYEAPAIFHGEAGILKEKNNFHLVNSKGKITIEYPLKSITRNVEGFYIIQNREGYFGVANEAGKEVIPAKYKSIQSYANGLFLVCDEHGYCGMIDKTGKITIPIKYNSLSYDPILNMYCGGIEKGWTMLKVK